MRVEPDDGVHNLRGDIQHHPSSLLIKGGTSLIIKYSNKIDSQDKIRLDNITQKFSLSLLAARSNLPARSDVNLNTLGAPSMD